MTASVDHLVYATPDLRTTVPQLHHDYGLELVAGGAHVGRGTRNWLAGLGGGTYLEVIGPDPDQPDPRAPRPFGIDDISTACLAAWCVRPDRSLPEVVSDVAAAGGDLGTVASMSRRRPDGVLLEWQLTVPDPLAGDALVPFCIDWRDSPHPSRSLTDSTRLESLELAHPSPVRLETVLAAIGLTLTVAAGPPLLRAVLHTPKGRVVLESA